MPHVSTIIKMNEDNTQEEIEEAIDKANYFKGDLTTKQEDLVLDSIN